MGKLSTQGNMKKTPIVHVRGEKKSYFVGTLMASRLVKSQFANPDGTEKMQSVYEFAVEDTDMEVAGDVENGGTVCIFAPTRLNNALRQATVGQRIKITYLGLGKATKHGGKPHEYEVEVL